MPSTGWKVSCAVRPMTSAASRGSCTPGSSTMIRRSPERVSVGSETPSASTRRRSTSTARSVDSVSGLDGGESWVSRTIWVPPRRSRPRRAGVVTRRTRPRRRCRGRRGRGLLVRTRVPPGQGARARRGRGRAGETGTARRPTRGAVGRLRWCAALRGQASVSAGGARSRLDAAVRRRTGADAPAGSRPDTVSTTSSTAAASRPVTGAGPCPRTVRTEESVRGADCSRAPRRVPGRATSRWSRRATPAGAAPRATARGTALEPATCAAAGVPTSTDPATARAASSTAAALRARRSRRVQGVTGRPSRGGGGLPTLPAQAGVPRSAEASETTANRATASTCTAVHQRQIASTRNSSTHTR